MGDRWVGDWSRLPARVLNTTTSPPVPCRPYGTAPCFLRLPSAEALGYALPSRCARLSCGTARLYVLGRSIILPESTPLTHEKLDKPDPNIEAVPLSLMVCAAGVLPSLRDCALFPTPS